MTKTDNKSQLPNDIFSPGSNYALFVGKSYGYYLVKWSKILHSKCSDDVEVMRKNSFSHMSWNFWAFLFGFTWLSYRKMYLLSFLFILVAALVPHFLLVEALALGLYGNKLYFRFVNKKLNKLEENIKNQDILKSEMLKSGATSKLSFIAASILFNAAVITMAALVVAIKLKTIELKKVGVSRDGISHAILVEDSKIISADEMIASLAYKEALKALKESDIDVNKTIDADGNTSLYLEARQGNLPKVKALLTLKADVNKANNKGETPLYIAIKHYSNPVANALMLAHADVNIADNDGKTPLIHSNARHQQSYVFYKLRKRKESNRSGG